MPGPPSLSISISTLTTLLAQRLGINLSGTDFWGQGELDLYIRQAIREFQVLTGYWRGRVQLATEANTPFYDLHASGTIPYTVNDTDILAQVGYHLLEFSGSQSNYVNTAQFSIGAIAAALDQRREEILGDARMVVQVYASNAPGPPPPFGRFTISSGVIQIHRADWYDVASELWNLLSRTDELGASGWSYGWPESNALPSAYSVALTRPFEIQLIATPVNDGQAGLLVTACNPYTFTGTPQLIQVPDDSAYALPWGILASVLSQDAQSRDYRRASYALQRFQAALQVLRTWPCVMQAWPNGIQEQPSTLFDLDHWQSGWRNVTPAAPTVVAMGGRNLVACSPVPNGVYNIALDAVVNSPGSTASRTATFDMPGDIVTAILDNGQHLATFKNNEFENTMDQYKAFLTVAEGYASRERAQAINFEALRAAVRIEEADRAYELQTVEA